MRKKSRLFMTVGSLCLALAILCFGVFAASTLAYNVSGSITYTVSDVFCSIGTQVFKSDVTQSIVDNDAFLELSGVTYTKVSTQVEDTALNYATGNVTNPTAPASNLTLHSIAFNSAGQTLETSLYKIVVTVTVQRQDGNVTITPSLTQKTPGTTISTNVGTYIQATSDAEDVLESGVMTLSNLSATRTVTINYFIYLKDVTLSAAGDFNLGVSIAKVNS